RQPDRRSNPDRCQNLLLPYSFAPSRRTSTTPAVCCAPGLSTSSAGLALVPVQQESSAFNLVEFEAQQAPIRLDDDGLTSVVQAGQNSYDDALTIDWLAQLQLRFLACEAPIIARSIERSLETGRAHL